jgi:hypothetical protein
MKGFIEVTQIVYRYPEKPEPEDKESFEYIEWIQDSVDYDAEPTAVRAPAVINVRDIKSFVPPDTSEHPAPIYRCVTVHLFSGDRYFHVEETYEELKRRITEATAP